VFKTLVAVEVTDGIFSIMALAVLLSIVGVMSGGPGRRYRYERLPFRGGLVNLQAVPC